MMHHPRLFFSGIAIASVSLALDQLSKHLLLAHFPENTQAIAITPFFNIVRVWNTGVSFGMFASQRQPLILSAISTAIVIGLLIWLYRNHNKVISIALGLIIGGAVGNIIDRLRFGAVSDFLDFYIENYHWPAFNVADSSIFIGVVLLCIHTMLWEKKPDEGQGQ